MVEFTPLGSTVGGVCIGLAAGLLLFCNGRIAGVSGIVGGLFGSSLAEFGWRMAFVLGLLGGGWIALAWVQTTHAPPEGSPLSTTGLIVAGVLVGLGTRLARGCTSGHGVCGISRFSPRSFSATAIFMATAAAVVFVTRHVLA